MGQNTVKSKVLVALIGSETNKIESHIKQFIYKLNDTFKEFNLEIVIFGIRHNEFNRFVLKCSNEFNINVKRIEYTNEFNIKYNIAQGYKLLHIVDYVIFFEPMTPLMKSLVNRCNKQNITYKIYERK